MKEVSAAEFEQLCEIRRKRLINVPKSIHSDCILVALT